MSEGNFVPSAEEIPELNFVGDVLEQIKSFPSAKLIAECERQIDELRNSIENSNEFQTCMDGNAFKIGNGAIILKQNTRQNIEYQKLHFANMVKKLNEAKKERVRKLLELKGIQLSEDELDEVYKFVALDEGYEAMISDVHGDLFSMLYSYVMAGAIYFIEGEYVYFSVQNGTYYTQEEFDRLSDDEIALGLFYAIPIPHINPHFKGKLVNCGDFVDRGCESIQCLCIAELLGITLGNQMVNIIGNHETTLCSRNVQNIDINNLQPQTTDYTDNYGVKFIIQRGIRNKYFKTVEIFDMDLTDENNNKICTIYAHCVLNEFLYAIFNFLKEIQEHQNIKEKVYSYLDRSVKSKLNKFNFSKFDYTQCSYDYLTTSTHFEAIDLFKIKNAIGNAFCFKGTSIYSDQENYIFDQNIEFSIFWKDYSSIDTQQMKQMKQIEQIVGHKPNTIILKKSNAIDLDVGRSHGIMSNNDGYFSRCNTLILNRKQNYMFVLEDLFCRGESLVISTDNQFMSKENILPAAISTEQVKFDQIYKAEIANYNNQSQSNPESIETFNSEDILKPYEKSIIDLLIQPKNLIELYNSEFQITSLQDFNTEIVEKTLLNQKIDMSEKIEINNDDNNNNNNDNGEKTVFEILDGKLDENLKYNNDTLYALLSICKPCTFPTDKIEMIVNSFHDTITTNTLELFNAFPQNSFSAKCMNTLLSHLQEPLNDNVCQILKSVCEDNATGITKLEEFESQKNSTLDYLKIVGCFVLGLASLMAAIIFVSVPGAQILSPFLTNLGISSLTAAIVTTASLGAISFMSIGTSIGIARKTIRFNDGLFPFGFLGETVRFVIEVGLSIISPFLPNKWLINIRVRLYKRIDKSKGSIEIEQTTTNAHEKLSAAPKNFGRKCLTFCRNFAVGIGSAIAHTGIFVARISLRGVTGFLKFITIFTTKAFANLVHRPFDFAESKLTKAICCIDNWQIQNSYYIKPSIHSLVSSAELRAAQHNAKLEKNDHEPLLPNQQNLD